MIDCFAFLFASWNPEKVFLFSSSAAAYSPHHLHPPPPPPLCTRSSPNEEPRAHWYRNILGLCFEIDLNRCWLSLCVFLTAVHCWLIPPSSLCTNLELQQP